MGKPRGGLRVDPVGRIAPIDDKRDERFSLFSFYRGIRRKDLEQL